jgi:iron complex outermembrane recepter protein
MRRRCAVLVAGIGPDSARGLSLRAWISPPFILRGSRMKYALSGCLLLVPAVVSAQGASAAAVQTDAAAEQASADTLDSIVVIGRKAETAPDPALVGSLDVIARSELDYEHVDDTSELFNKLPGVYIARYNQGLINSDIAIRGFAGDGETPHAKLLIDGIPANLHNGFGEMDQLFPIGIAGITVFKGTSDPRVGLFNIAGNTRIDTRTDLTREIEIALGSYGAPEMQGYFGFEHGALKHSYFAGYRESEGYRDRTDLKKYALGGRWAYAFGDETTLALIARASGYDGDAPGYLTRAESRRDPRASATYANQDGGDKAARHASLHFDHRFGEGVALSAKAYYQTFERERWVRFSQAAALQNRFDDQQQQGLIATLSWDIDDRWRVEGGVDAQFEDVIEQRFGTIGQRRVRNPAAVLRNRDFEFDTTGAYLRVGMREEGRYGWNIALRADRIDGDYTQFNAAGVPSTREIFRFGAIVQPKFNGFVNLGERAQLFANAGRSFQHPLSADAFTAGDRGARDVSINDGWELGASWRPTDALQLRLSYWRQKAEDEFVVVDGVAQNVGRTERDGIDFGFNWTLGERWYVWGNATTVDGRIVRPADNRRAFVGNTLRSIPERTGSLGVNFDASDAVTARLHVDHQGEYYVNEANLGGRYGDYTLAHASLDWRLGWGTLGFQVNNLFDRYYEYVFDFSENGADTIHSPGDGRAFGVSLRVAF